MPQLIDQLSYNIDSVSISVTGRYDLCFTDGMPEKFDSLSESDSWLGFNKTTFVAAAFSRLGVSEARVAEGEALLIYPITMPIHDLSALPEIQDLSLSSNVTRLVANAYKLRNNDIDRINASLVRLKAGRFERLTEGKLNMIVKTFKAIRNAMDFKPERHECQERPEKVLRFMAKLGA